MAITDYSTLVAAIKVWCARSDSVFNGQIDTFIGMAEDRIYNGYGERGEPAYSPPLRTKVMEATATIALTNGEGTIPDDFLAARKLTRSGDDFGITYIGPERYEVLKASSQAGTPLYYTTEGTTLRTVPANSSSLTLSYYKRLPALTLAAPSNAVLLGHPNIYLEAALYEAFSFTQAVDLAVAHATRCRSLVQGANGTAAALRAAGPLRVRNRQPIP